jgi:hypothetical protein
MMTMKKIDIATIEAARNDHLKPATAMQEFGASVHLGF